MIVMGVGGGKGEGKRIGKVTRVSNLSKVYEKSVKTGLAGIEKNISVFLQPTLQSRKLVTKEDSQNRSVSNLMKWLKNRSDQFNR